MYTPAEEECEKQFQSIHAHDSSGRYIVKLPFENSAHSSTEKLGSFFNSACQKLRSMEANCKKILGSDLYTKFMLKYEDLKHMQ